MQLFLKNFLGRFKYYHHESFKLKEKGIIKKGIDNFYSNQCYRFFFTDLINNYKEKLTDSLQIGIRYSDLNNKIYSKKVELTLSELAGITTLNPPDNYIGKIAYELSEIKKLIKAEFGKVEDFDCDQPNSKGLE